MLRFLNLSNLNTKLLDDYHKTISDAFPKVTQSSQVIKEYWHRLESYFPDYQLIAIDDQSQVIGMMNTIPLHWSGTIGALPDAGWDWMLQKGIDDYEQKISANFLGGLQVIVAKRFQGKGFSKILLAEAKKRMFVDNFQNFIIPIRPTFKYQYPDIPMELYIKKTENDKIYDPWIRTHVNGGAKIIKVCSKSMKISGDVEFWKDILQLNKISSGKHIVEGGLSRVEINVEKNFGIYNEENVWVVY